jgi:hypothetical protein
MQGGATVKTAGGALSLQVVESAPTRPPHKCRSVYVGKFHDENAARVKECIWQRNKQLYSEDRLHTRVYPQVKKDADTDSTPVNCKSCHGVAIGNARSAPTCHGVVIPHSRRCRTARRYLERGFLAERCNSAEMAVKAPQATAPVPQASA